MKIIHKVLAIAWFVIMGQSIFAIDVQNYWNRPAGLMAQCEEYSPSGDPINGLTFNKATWHGTLWGRDIYWHGTDWMESGDLFESQNGNLLYIGTFHGNEQIAPDSTIFTTPIVWMHADMSVGETIDSSAGIFYDMSPDNRESYPHSPRTSRTQLVAHYASYYDPGSKITFNDVIDFRYWPDASQTSNYEEYWCARGLGSIRWTGNEGATYIEMKGGVGYVGGNPVDFGDYGYVLNLYPLAPPSNPWYSTYQPPDRGAWFGATSSVWNGTFESGLNGWLVSSNCTTTTALGSVPASPGDLQNYDNAGPNKLVIQPLGGGRNGSTGTLTVSSAQIIPVTEGEQYRLSGYVYRLSSSDSVYVDLNGGLAYGPPINGRTGPAVVHMTNSMATASQVQQWQYVSVDFTVPAGVYGVVVRCGHSLSTVSAYFDDIRLQLKP